MRSSAYSSARGCWLVFLLVLSFSVPALAQIFVKADATGANDGSSWEDAFTELDTALRYPMIELEIWVAEGTYTVPIYTGFPRKSTFTLRGLMALYGGFAGTETAVDQRRVPDHPTILSGEIGAPGFSDNAYHVVTAHFTDTTTVLDGFIITGGNGDDPHGAYRTGAGLLAGSASLTVSNCVFTGNKESPSIGLVGGSATVVNCVFDGNDGGVHVRGSLSNPTFTNVLSVNNAFFGVSFQYGAGGIVTNSVVWGNSGTQMAGGAAIVSHSLIQDCGGSGPLWNPIVGVDGGNNIDADPLFVDLANGDLRLRPPSPAAGAGDNNAPYLPPKDLAGNPRIIGDAVDMGVYENRLMVYVDDDGTGSGGSWADASNDLYAALVLPWVGEIWVAEGTYTTPLGIGDGRAGTFPLKNEVALYGGFAGTETSPTERHLVDNPTILTADIGVGGPSDNSYHVVTVDSTDSTAVIDGFIITGGNADGTFPDNDGGGMLIRGGVPAVRNCIFRDNWAANRGGGVFIDNGSPVLVNCLFYENEASEGGGLAGGTPIVTNPTFANNTARLRGGATFNSGPSLGGLIINAIVWGNTAPTGPGSLSPPMTFSYSHVQNSGGSGPLWDPTVGMDGGLNRDEDPLFEDAAGGNFRLLGASGAIDAGRSSAPNMQPIDLDGDWRIIFVVDRGAYENIPDVGTGINDPDGPLPKETALRVVYPNPFNPTVTVAFDLDRRRHVQIDIYDVQGKLVRKLIDETRSPGTHDVIWDGTNGRRRSVAGGVYFVLLRSEGFRDQQKIVLLK